MSPGRNARDNRAYAASTPYSALDEPKPKVTGRSNSIFIVQLMQIAPNDERVPVLTYAARNCSWLPSQICTAGSAKVHAVPTC